MNQDFQEQLRSQISSALRKGQINHQTIESMTSELLRLKDNMDLQQ